jgi:hypothetical protein
MELEERRPSAENLPSQAKNARSEVIEEEQQARTYLSGWRLHVLTAGQGDQLLNVAGREQANRLVKIGCG